MARAAARLALLLLAVAASAAAASTDAPTEVPDASTGTVPAGQTDPTPDPDLAVTTPNEMVSTTAPCSPSNCVAGTCHHAATCASNKCVYLNKDDGDYCEDADSFPGTCKAGVCFVRKQPAIKSYDSHLVLHTPGGGDVRMSSSDLPADISLRNLAQDVNNAIQAEESLNTRLSGADDQAAAATQERDALAERIADLTADVADDFAAVTADIGSVEVGVSTNANALRLAQADISANTDAIGSLQDTDDSTAQRLAELAVDKASTDMLSSGIAQVQQELQNEASDIRDLQAELATKVITLDDKTTEHNSFIQAMMSSIATQGGRLDGHDGDIEALQQTRQTKAQVEDLISEATEPLATKAMFQALSAQVSTNTKAAAKVDDLEEALKYTTIVARAGAGLSVKTTLSEEEAIAAARDACAKLNMGFDEDKVSCRECESGIADSGRCVESDTLTAKVVSGLDLKYTSCGGKTTYNLLGENGLRYNMKSAGSVRLQFSIDGYYGSNSVCSYGRMYAYFVIDGVQQGTCHYATNYQYYYYSYGGSTKGRTLHCDVTWALTAGEHTINFNVYQYGSSEFDYKTGVATVQRIGTVSRTPSAESKNECKQRTDKTMLATYMSGSRSSCGSSSWYMAGYFAQSGRWTFRTVTGVVRITLRVRTYFYPGNCYSYSRGQIQPVIDGSVLSTAGEIYENAQYSYEQDYHYLLVDFIYKTTPGRTFNLDFYAYMLGYVYYYGSTYESPLTVVDLAPANAKPPAVFPKGCTNLARNYLVQSFMNGQSSQNNLNAITQTSLDGKVGPYKFTTNYDNAIVRVYFKAQAYLYVSSYYSYKALASITPRLNGKTLDKCAEMRQETYSGRSDYAEHAIVCQAELTIATKGEQTLSFYHGAAGYRSYLKGNQYSSIVLVEELVRS